MEKNRKLARGHFSQPSHKGFGCNLPFIRIRNFSNVRLKQTRRLFRKWYLQIPFQGKYLTDGVSNLEKHTYTIANIRRVISTYMT